MIIVGVVVGALLSVLVFGQDKTWNWIESQWRLDVGAPVTTTPYPDDIGDPLVRLAAAGDVGTGGNAERATATAMDRLEQVREFDALLLLGDNVYPAGDPTSIKTKLLEPLAPVLDGPTELIAALGNHDVKTGDGDPQIAALGLPGRWYEREIGPVRVVVVDSTKADDTDQIAWVRQTLSAPTDKDWTVVVQHHPPFSAGYHGSHGPSDANLVPLYTEFSVDLVLAGHDHDYQRTSPQGGVTYIVSGAAAKLRPTGRASFTEYAASTYHFTELAVYADRLEIRAVDQNGEVFDTATLSPH